MARAINLEAMMKRRNILKMVGLGAASLTATAFTPLSGNPYYEGPISDHFDGTRFFGLHEARADFAAIAELQSQGRKGNLAVLGNAKVLADSSSGILVSDTDRLIALIGVEDIIVVDTPDALLVTTKEHAQRVKSLVDALKATGHSDVL